MQQRTTPEDVQDDALLKLLLTAWDFIENNYPKILAGLGGVAVVVLIAVFINRQQGQNAIEAQIRLGEAHIALLQANFPEAIFKSEQVVAEYGDSPASRQALLLAANLKFESKNYSAAQVDFQKYLDDFGSDGPPGYSAWAGVAFCLEAQGDLGGAGNKFAAYADAYSHAPFAPIALKEAARCLKAAGNLGQAQATYQKIVDEYKKSDVARVARSELKQMGVNVN
ncbi:MAG: tetratricopeptide repeat protein [bacterium]|nr:tetratricopeptide repeat protein [bacterium]